MSYIITASELYLNKDMAETLRNMIKPKIHTFYRDNQQSIYITLKDKVIHSHKYQTAKCIKILVVNTLKFKEAKTWKNGAGRFKNA